MNYKYIVLTLLTACGGFLNEPVVTPVLEETIDLRQF